MKSVLILDMEKGEMCARSARKKLQLHETQRIHFVFSYRNQSVSFMQLYFDYVEH